MKNPLKTGQQVGLSSMMLLCSSLCFADEVRLEVNMAARHFNREAVVSEHLNEINPGLGLEFIDGDYRKSVGFYKNSNSKQSVYALLGWTPLHAGRVSVGFVAGAVTGYDLPYRPAAGLLAVAKVTDKVNLNLTVVPTIESARCFGFVGFQLGVRF